MLGVMENQLEYEKIPWGYELCFNKDCQLRDQCLHYQAYQLKPAEKVGGAAVYPDAWKSGECVSFREAKLVQWAWGFDGLYKNVPRHQRADARSCVRSYFSCGFGPYYRYHHGDKMLSPRQQQDIMAILAKFGSIEGLTFDHYVTDWDFND